MNMEDYYIHRYVRTENSEGYVIFNSKGRVGDLNIHSTSCVYGCLILEQELSEEEIDKLISLIDEDITRLFEPREDFILQLYKGAELGYYSDNVEDSPYDPIKKKDLDEVKKEIKRFSSYHEIAKGQLNEIAVCDYFRNKGYESQVTNADLDRLKIDVIAKQKNEIIYAQVKLGQVSVREIIDFINNVVSLRIDENMIKVACVVADRFPNDIELLRVQFEDTSKIKIIFIHKYQVISTSPKYKRVLGS